MMAVTVTAAEFAPTGQYMVPLPVGPYSNSTPRYTSGVWTTDNPSGWELFRAIQNNFMYVTNYARTNGGGSLIASGLTTNIAVIFSIGGTTNTLNFTNGVLMAINGSTAPVHGPSLKLPGGGYLLQVNGGTFLTP